MGVFLTGGYVSRRSASRRRPPRTPASSPACSSCSRRCSAPSSCASGSAIAGSPPACRCSGSSSCRERRRLRPARRRPRFLCAISLAAHILATAARWALRRRRLLVVQLGVVGAHHAGDRRARGRPRGARGRHRLVGADRHLADRERARLLRPDVRAAARAAGAHGADPRRGAGVRRPVRLAAERRAPDGAAGSARR